MGISPAYDIEQAIYFIRCRRVMLAHDLAELYGVRTKALLQAVKRHRSRFPSDFMFQMTIQELTDWRSQFVTSNLRLKMGLRRLPFAFTEHGVVMLSSILKSERAVQVNIAIARTFVRLRGALSIHRRVLDRLAELEQKGSWPRGSIGPPGGSHSGSRGRAAYRGTAMDRL